MNKKLIIGITAVVIGAGTLTAGLVSAGDGWGRCGDRDEGRHHDRYEQMGKHGYKSMKQMRYIAQELELTDEQRDQMKDLMRNQRNAMFDQKDTMQDMREELRDLDVSAADYDKQVAVLVEKAQGSAAELVTIRAEQKKAMFDILTPEQQVEFMNMKR